MHVPPKRRWDSARRIPFPSLVQPPLRCHSQSLSRSKRHLDCHAMTSAPQIVVFLICGFMVFPESSVKNGKPDLSDSPLCCLVGIDSSCTVAPACRSGAVLSVIFPDRRIWQGQMLPAFREHHAFQQSTEIPVVHPYP